MIYFKLPKIFRFSLKIGQNYLKKIKKKGYLYSHFKLYKKKNNIYFLLFYYNLKIEKKIKYLNNLYLKNLL